MLLVIDIHKSEATNVETVLEASFTEQIGKRTLSFAGDYRFVINVLEDNTDIFKVVLDILDYNFGLVLFLSQIPFGVTKFIWVEGIETGASSEELP